MKVYQVMQSDVEGDYSGAIFSTKEKAVAHAQTLQQPKPNTAESISVWEIEVDDPLRLDALVWRMPVK